ACARQLQALVRPHPCELDVGEADGRGRPVQDQRAGAATCRREPKLLRESGKVGGSEPSALDPGRASTCRAPYCSSPSNSYYTTSLRYGRCFLRESKTRRLNEPRSPHAKEPPSHATTDRRTRSRANAGRPAAYDRSQPKTRPAAPGECARGYGAPPARPPPSPP